jgi:hypothetical protein
VLAVDKKNQHNTKHYISKFPNYPQKSAKQKTALKGCFLFEITLLRQNMLIH